GGGALAATCSTCDTGLGAPPPLTRTAFSKVAGAGDVGDVTNISRLGACPPTGTEPSMVQVTVELPLPSVQLHSPCSEEPVGVCRVTMPPGSVSVKVIAPVDGWLPALTMRM